MRRGHVFWLSMWITCLSACHWILPLDGRRGAGIDSAADLGVADAERPHTTDTTDIPNFDSADLSIFGKSSPGTGWANHSEDLLRVYRFELKEKAKLHSIVILLRGTHSGSGTQPIQAAVYDDETGEPKTLVDTSPPATFSTTYAEQWTAFPLKSNPTVPAGYYWIGSFSGKTSGPEKSVVEFSHDTATSNVERIAHYYFANGLAPVFNTTYSPQNRRMSVYVTYSPQ